MQRNLEDRFSGLIICGSAANVEQRLPDNSDSQRLSDF